MVAGAIGAAFENWGNGIRSDQPFLFVLAKGSMVYVHDMIITVQVRERHCFSAVCHFPF